MNDNDDLERTLDRSLEHRSREIYVAPAGLDAVWDRVDRRRNRRRHAAVVGSIAAVAVGAFGFVAVARSGPDTITPAASPGAPSVPDQQAAWRCTDQLNHFDEGSPAVFFVSCEQVTVDGSAEVFDMPDPTIPAPIGTFVDVPATAPPTTSPEGSLVTHTVQAGDTVASIAEHFGVTVDQILELNAWEGGTDVQLPVGEVILIALTQAYPDPTVPATSVPTHIATTTTSIVTLSPTVTSIEVGEQRYEIQVGDSLASIAETFEITIEQLIAYNELVDGLDHVLLPGNEIRIPPNAAIVEQPQRRFATTTTSLP